MLRKIDNTSITYTSTSIGPLIPRSPSIVLHICNVLAMIHCSMHIMTGHYFADFIIGWSIIQIKLFKLCITITIIQFTIIILTNIWLTTNLQQHIKGALKYTNPVLCSPSWIGYKVINSNIPVEVIQIYIVRVIQTEWSVKKLNTKHAVKCTY